MAATLPLVMEMTVRPKGGKVHRPLRSAGNRMIDCPYYGDCLRIAMVAGWRTWNCESCLLYSPEEPLMSACGTIRTKGKNQAAGPAAPVVPKFKRCVKCGRNLEVNTENFRPNPRAKDGYGPTCKVCIQNKYEATDMNTGNRLARRKRVVLDMAKRRPLLQRLATDARACNDTIEGHTLWIIETYFRAIDGENVAPRGGR